MRYSEIINEAGEQPIYYFSYGMLTNPDLMQGADFIGPALLQNHKFEFYKYADVVQAGGSNVDGVLWQLPPDYIRELDRVENYPNMYGRKTVPVFTKDGKRYEAWVYYMTPAAREYLKRDRMPVLSYIQSIIDGYRHAGIKPQQVSDAYYELV